MSAANRGSDRIDQDYYPTPAYAVDLILERINDRKVKTSLEPCRGKASIIYDRMPGTKKLWAEIERGIDYLNWPYPQVDLIITNPPFSLALEFLAKSLTESITVVYLLRVNFLGSQKRQSFWQQNPLSHLYVLSKRPSFVNGKTDATEYAWFVWDRGNIMLDRPGVYVI